ncbi:MAG: M3 family metallopeptidase [Promicromonosporaceae bacterium]|nr:M3 family metallopeptidase [Promicromonosporaceae bacterium]
MNPFSAPSPLPYELPDYATIRPEHYEPAIVEGMAAHRAEVAAIAADTAAPTAENTLHALERAGQHLERAAIAFYNQIAADATPELEAIEERIAPLLAAHSDAVTMDRALHARLTALRAAADAGEAALAADEAWLLKTLLDEGRRAGVTLDDDAQARLKEINVRLAELEAEFGRKLLAGANAASVLVTDEAELDGLDASAIAGAKAAAESRGQEGWLLEMQLPTGQDVLSSLTGRDLRRRIQEASEARGAVAGEHDTRATLLETMALRAEKANLLGYEHYAAYVAEDSTAKTAGAVAEMLDRLAPPAVRNARAEAADLETALRADVGGAAELTAADWSYYAQQVRREQFSLDDALLRPYLELERTLISGVFEATKRLFGLSFVERPDLLGYHDDVRVFEVFDSPEPGAPNEGLGLFLADLFTRETKRGGAWMNNLVDQNTLLGQRPVVVNNLNIVRAPAGQPTLLGWDEVITLFHEFGHAVHGLLSAVRFPSQSGTNVPRDFVEFPSQVYEMWAWEPEILKAYAVHFETGEPLPAEWIQTLIASKSFGEGFGTTEYLGAALIDQAWHRLTPEQVPTDPADVVAFEAAALRAAGLDYPAVPPRYRSTYFNHMFGGYGAAYYSYVWSEVLDADTVKWYEENGGLTRANGDRYRRDLLGPGGSRDPLLSFRRLRGRDAEITPLLERKGLL